MKSSINAADKDWLLIVILGEIESSAADTVAENLGAKIL
jgi:hypothetical protein